MPKPEEPKIDLTCARVIVQGLVQGVGYRFFVQDAANEMALFGWVKNKPNGDVEAVAEGSRDTLERWVDRLREGPPLSRVDRVEVTWQPYAGRYRRFSIV